MLPNEHWNKQLMCLSGFTAIPIIRNKTGINLKINTIYIVKFNSDSIKPAVLILLSDTFPLCKSICVFIKYIEC
jgi:hypothetical protein